MIVLVNIGPDLATKITHGLSNCSIFNTMPQTNGFSLFLSPCTAFEIITTVSGLANSSGIGVDGFFVKIIKSIIEYLADPLEIIFNKSFHLGIFPDGLKQEKITPVHKADDKLQVTNYLPISVLPMVSKVLKKLNIIFY